MGHVTGAELSAAVSNAGGIGTIGAIGMSTEGLQAEIQRLKNMLIPGTSIAGTVPFGVDLLLPKVGGGARKTNKDYTGGQLNALVDMMIAERVPLFVCAVGVPPQWVVDKMHANGGCCCYLLLNLEYIFRFCCAVCVLVWGRGKYRIKTINTSLLD
jgi:NAD(P)H-dependent flavin oxidoreductase YrpB (nitropropane dioxygenase family)